MDQMKIEEKLRNDVEQIEQNYKLDLREREQIEEMLNRDLAAAKDEIGWSDDGYERSISIASPFQFFLRQ